MIMPCHTATSISDFLKEEHIKVLNWPPQSPDLNTIENLWAWIKRKHENEFPFPKSKNELIENIFNIWDSIPEEIVKNLSNSVKRRLYEVIRMNGRPTKY